MNKGIWAIIIAIAFIAGGLMTNPVAEAAGGWKEALENLIVDWSQLTGIPADIADGDDDTVYTDADAKAAVGPHVKHRTLRTTQDVAIPAPLLDTVVLEQQFSLSETSSIKTTSTVYVSPDGDSTTIGALNLEIDGVVQTRVWNSLDLEPDTLALSWAGELPAGDHTITVKTATANHARVCSNSANFCTMNTLIIG